MTCTCLNDVFVKMYINILYRFKLIIKYLKTFCYKKVTLLKIIMVRLSICYLIRLKHYYFRS